MNRRQIRALRAGDEVTWTDPDGGICTRTLVVAEIEVRGDVVAITDRDGGYLECLAEEVS